MAIEARLGRYLFALSIVALGIESLWLGVPVMRLELWQKSWPYYAQAGRVVGVVFVLLGAGLLVDRFAKLSAAALALILLVWAVVFHLAKLLPAVDHGDHWGGFAECLAVFAAAWVLAAQLAPRWTVADWGIPFGRICFGVALVIFGAVHFIYLGFVADFIPHWIPYRPFLAEATGFAHVFAGLATLTGVQGRLGANLAALMYASWVVILHIPRALAAGAADGPFEWNGVFVAMVLSAGALLVAASFRPGRDAMPR